MNRSDYGMLHLQTGAEDILPIELVLKTMGEFKLDSQGQGVSHRGVENQSATRRVNDLGVTTDGGVFQLGSVIKPIDGQVPEKERPGSVAPKNLGDRNSIVG